MNPDRYSVPFGPREPFIFQLVKPGLGRLTIKAPTAWERCQDREHERSLHRLGARLLRRLGRSSIDSVYYFCNSLSGFRSARRSAQKVGTQSVLLERLVVKHYIEQRLVHPNAAVVLYEAQLTETVHEAAHLGAGCADHLRQSLLRDFRQERLRLARFAEIRP